MHAMIISIIRAISSILLPLKKLRGQFYTGKKVLIQGS
jgi:hypothetical protein